jgi:hypothetical protein
MTPSELVATAEDLWEAGLSAIPFKVSSDGRVIGPKGWPKYCNNPPNREEQAEFRKLFLADHNAIFLACGRVINGRRLICIDVDDDRLVALVESVLGPTICGRFGSKGIGVFVWVDRSDEFFKSKQQTKFKSGKIGVELLTLKGGSFVPPSRHRTTGVPYEWRGSRLSDALHTLPELTRIQWDIIDAVVRAPETFSMIEGGDTHDSATTLCAKLVRLSPDDELLIRIVKSVFPGNYQGSNDSDREIGRALASARKKGFDNVEANLPEESLKRLNAFSETHCVVSMDGKTLILEKGFNVEMKRQVYNFWRPADLKSYYLDETVQMRCFVWYFLVVQRVGDEKLVAFVLGIDDGHFVCFEYGRLGFVHFTAPMTDIEK